MSGSGLPIATDDGSCYAAPVHDPDTPCLAEELLARLLPALIRAGDVQEATVLALADELDNMARVESVERSNQLTTMSAMLREWAIEAAGPTQSEWLAERLRGRLRVVPTDPTP